MNTKQFLAYAVAAFIILFTTQCGKKESVSKTDDNIIKETKTETRTDKEDKNHKLINGEVTVADAQAAYDIEDYETAVEVAHKFAEENNAEAQNLLGLCYANGNGVEQSYTEAVKWYTKAAEQGYAEAQCNLGNCYYNGEGVTKDKTEAVKWYKKAAEQGYEDAQKALKRLQK